MSCPETVVAMAAVEKGAEFSKWEYKIKPEGVNDCTIRVLYNGICGTDRHMQNNDWGMSSYPLVPGHEIVGEVISVGSAVKDVKVGTVVGLGCIAQTCGTCERCTTEHLDNICPKIRFTYFHEVTDETGTFQHRGGFSSYIRTPADKVIPIPTGVDHAEAGPLMCAGVTTFTPLYELSGNTCDLKGKSVGIVGIGGLGHLAVQFASKMGAEVTAISRNDSKKEFASKLGAHKYLSTSDAAAMEAAAKSFDFVLMCIAGGSLDVMPYIGLLRPYGNLHFVGVPEAPISFQVQALMFTRLSVSASPIGSTEQCKKMLEFAAANGIRPIIEKFKHSEANKAMGKVVDGSIRFRAVLENDLI